MNLIKIDGYELKKFMIAGANRLNENKEEINTLNVFPVPDGDTGTNMSLTVLAAVREMEKIDSPNIYDVAKALSTGSLRGARGNSGVILSQLFRGFSKALEGKDIASIEDIANALEKASEMAYKAVMKPKEGTILTVARAIGEKSKEMVGKTTNIVSMIRETMKYANKVLASTTNMLEELKQAGVVDAGGKGLISILEGGFLDRGKNAKTGININIASTTKEDKDITINTTSEVDIKYSYCTEFFINTTSYDEKKENELKEFLQKIGDSIVMASDDDFIKVHIHTNEPGRVLDRAIKLGSLDNIKIENMKIQHSNLINFNVKKDYKKYGFIAICSGDGISNTFKEYGVDEIINGGQSMNPSVEDILLCVDKVYAENIYLLPNNKNIMLAAKRVSEVCKDKNIIVIGTTSIAQGITALTSFLPNLDIDENTDNMNESIKEVLTGEITYAVRNTKIGDMDIAENDILCIIDGKIENTASSTLSGAKKVIQNMMDKKDDASAITVYYGEDIREEADTLEKYLLKKYDDLCIEFIDGGQPIYNYIIAVE